MKLIGFTFIENQAEFEKWQMAHKDYAVCTVQPHVANMKISNDEKHTSDHDVSAKWGVFVTYSYDCDA